MQRYKEFQPTGFDAKGAFLRDEEAEWLVAPVSQTRDSGTLTRSNFRVVLADLGGEENEDLQVHRFGHWGPGWFEIIIVRPDSATAAKAEEWETALADYPVADESDYSELEHEDACLYWETLSIRERYEYVERDGGFERGTNIFSLRGDGPPPTVTGEIYYQLADGC